MLRIRSNYHYMKARKKTYEKDPPAIGYSRGISFSNRQSRCPIAHFEHWLLGS